MTKTKKVLSLTDDQKAEIFAYLSSIREQDGYLSALRLYREWTGASLLEAVKEVGKLKIEMKEIQKEMKGQGR